MILTLSVLYAHCRMRMKFSMSDKMSKRVQETMNEDCESAITDAKYGFISGALKETFTDNHLEQAKTTKVLDSIVTHRVWGFPIFFLFMYLMFEGTLHPNPIIRGKNDFPCNPILCMILSMIKAARAI